MILHNILCGKGAAARQVVNFIRDEKSLNVIVEWLVSDKNEKLLSIIVDIVQIVCDKNGEQKVSGFKSWRKTEGKFREGFWRGRKNELCFAILNEKVSNFYTL